MSINKSREDYRFYKIWADMKYRCTNPSCKVFYNYGGRGILYCYEWKDYNNFKADMWESYLKHSALYGEKQTTLDRIDVNDYYYKENCRWANYQTQRVNIRNKEEYCGYNIKTKQFYNFNNCADFCRKLGFNRQSVMNCINTNYQHHGCVFVKIKTNIQDAYRELLQKANLKTELVVK